MNVLKPAALVTAVAVVVLGSIALGSSTPSPPAATAASRGRPNIVFILTDDLSWNLVNRRFAPHIVELERRGETFSNYFVADSLCCPSRATILTGLFPHDTKVGTNIAPDGGFAKFQSERLDKRTFAVALRSAGHRTSMMGKYLNGYGDPQMTPASAPIPPGWSDWHVSNSTGYLEFNYVLNDNGAYTAYGAAPEDYGVDVLNAKARSFIDGAGQTPFMLEIATFAPHAPYTPAPRNADDFPGLTEPRDPSFNTNNRNAPAWLGHRKPLTPARIAALDAVFRKRAQSVEAIDKLLADVQAEIAAKGLADNTYIVFSSDNGYHLGQHRLARGKKTAFDTDIRVPLIIAGPGVPHGRTVPQVTQSVDLYPTFAQLAGITPSKHVEGRSLMPLLRAAKTARAWRTVALVEHQATSKNPLDPDFEEGEHGAEPTTYEAIRMSSRHVRAVYIEYKDARHEREYYDLRKDPYERNNIAKRLSPARRRALHGTLSRLAHCHSATACWTAAAPRR
jgi:N-acetylglucosamine-6-sulfatase